jgi:murein DD-endopeptidase MepM/ murein hydrolase activator NlpD
MTWFSGNIFPSGRPLLPARAESHRASKEHTVGDSKALPIVGGVMLVLLLPLIIVMALIVGGLAGMDAAASDCDSQSTETDGKAFAWPTDKHDIDQGWQDPDSEGTSHPGIDFDVDEGSKVYAAEAGEITSIADHKVVIKHNEGIETRYWYLKDIKVKLHEKVKRGQQIATSGSGDETAPGLVGDHLHFELWIDTKDDGDLVNTKPEDDSFGDAGKSDDTGGAGCCDGGDLTGNNNAQKAFNYFASNGYSKEQAAGIVGNIIHESSVEPGRLQGTPSGTVTKPSDAVGSSLGWGIVQWTPAGKMIKPSRQAGIDDDTIVSLQYQLEFLAKQLKGETPIPETTAGDKVKAAKTVEDAAVAFGRYYERFAGADDLSNSRYAERKTAAKQVLSTFGDGAPTGAGGCGAGSGNIAAVAKSLAWPSEGHTTKPYADNATDAYKKAFFQYNKSAKSAGDTAWTDCGRFVATVMHMSGADPDYPDVDTSAQDNYLRTSEKYEVHDDWDVSKLQPGDILIKPGHTYLFVGPWADGHNAAAASLDGPNPGPGHVPQADNAYAVGTTYAVARLKKK